MLTTEQLLTSTVPKTYGQAEELYCGFLQARWRLKNPKIPEEGEPHYSARCCKCVAQSERNIAAALTHFLAMREMNRGCIIAEANPEQKDEFASWLRRLTKRLRARVGQRTASNYKSELNRWFAWLIMPRLRDDLSRVFARALRTLMDRSGLSDKEIASRSNLRVGTLQQWASGQCEPQNRMRQFVTKLEEVFDVVPGTLTNRCRRFRLTLKRQNPNAYAKRVSSLAKLPYALPFSKWPKRLQDLFETLYRMTEPGRRTGRTSVVAPGTWRRRRNGTCHSRDIMLAHLCKYLGFLVLPKDAESPYLRGKGIPLEDLTFDVFADYELIEGYLDFCAVRAGYVAERVLTEAEKWDPTGIKGRLTRNIEGFSSAVRYFIDPERGLLTQTAATSAAEILQLVKSRASAAGICEELWATLAARTALEWAAIASGTQEERDGAADQIVHFWAHALDIPAPQYSKIIGMSPNRWAERVTASLSVDHWLHTCEITSRRLKQDVKESKCSSYHGRRDEENAERILKEERPMLEFIHAVEKLESEIPDISELISPDGACQLKSYRRRREELAVTHQMLTLTKMSTAVQLRTSNWLELTIADMTMSDGTVKTANLTRNDNGTYHVHVDHRDLKYDKDAAGGDFDVDLPPAVSPTIDAQIRDHRPYLFGPESPFLFRPNPAYSDRGGRRARERQSAEMKEKLRMGPITADLLNNIFKKFTRLYLGAEPGFGIYVMRHIAATDYVKNHPGGFLVAATMLHNSVRMILKYYAHLCDQDTFRQWTAYYEVLIQESKKPDPNNLVRLENVSYQHLGAVLRAANAAIAQGLSLHDFAAMTRKAYEQSLAERFRPGKADEAA